VEEEEEEDEELNVEVAVYSGDWRQFTPTSVPA
jgi:hypothetical protein